MYEFGAFDSGDELAAAASGFAYATHAGQKRKYTGEDYVLHCISVLSIIEDHTNHPPSYAKAAAIMHDCIEDAKDPDATLFAMTRMFPANVVDLVIELTDTPVVPGLNRARRKEIDRGRLASASYWAQTIKCADMIDNTGSIILYDPDFAVTYLEEKALLLPLLTNASPKLWEMANKTLVAAQEKLVQLHLGKGLPI